MYTNFKDAADSSRRADTTPTFLSNAHQPPIVPNDMGKQPSGPQWNISRPNPLPYGYRGEGLGNNQLPPLMHDGHYQNCAIRSVNNTNQRIVRPTARINCQANCNGLAYCNHNHTIRNAQQWNLSSENNPVIPSTSSSNRQQQFPPTDTRLHNRPTAGVDGSISNFSRYPGETVSSHHGNVATYKEDSLSQERPVKHHLSNNGMSSKKESNYDCRVGCSSNCPHVQHQNSCKYPVPSQIPLNVALQQTPGHWMSNSHGPSDSWALQEDSRQMIPIEGVDMTVNNPLATKYWAQRKLEAKNGTPETSPAFREITRKFQQEFPQKRYRDNPNKDQHKMLDWCPEGARGGNMLPPFPADCFPDSDQSSNSNNRAIHPPLPFDPYTHTHGKVLQHNYNPESSHLHSRLTSHPSYSHSKMPKGNYLQSHVTPAHSNNYIRPHDNITSNLNHNLEGNSTQNVTKVQYMPGMQSYANASLNSCNDMFENVNYGQSMQVMDNSCLLTNKSTLGYQHDMPHHYENMLQQECNNMVGNMFYDKSMPVKQMGYNSFYGNNVLDPSQTQNNIPSPFIMMPQSNVSDSILPQNVPVNHPHPLVASDAPTLIDGRPVKKRKHQYEDVSITTKGGEKAPPLDLRQFIATWNENEESELPHSNMETASRKSESMFVLDCTNLERSSGEPNAAGRKSDEGVIQLFKVGLDAHNQETFASVIKPLSECRKSLESIHPRQKYRYKSIQEASFSSLKCVTEKIGSPLYTNITASDPVMEEFTSSDTQKSEHSGDATANFLEQRGSMPTTEQRDRSITINIVSDCHEGDLRSAATSRPDKLELANSNPELLTTFPSNSENLHERSDMDSSPTEKSPSALLETQENNVQLSPKIVPALPKDSTTAIHSDPNSVHSPMENRKDVANDSSVACSVLVSETHAEKPTSPMIVEQETAHCKQNDVQLTPVMKSVDDCIIEGQDDSEDISSSVKQASSQPQDCENSVIKYISSEVHSEDNGNEEAACSVVDMSCKALNSSDHNMTIVDTSNATHSSSQQQQKQRKKENLEESLLELLPDTYSNDSTFDKPIKTQETEPWKYSSILDKDLASGYVALTETQTLINESSDDIELELHPSYDEAFYNEFEKDSSINNTAIDLEKDDKVALSLNESIAIKLKEDSMRLQSVTVDLSEEDNSSDEDDVELHSHGSCEDCEIIEVKEGFEENVALSKLNLHKDEHNDCTVAVSESGKDAHPTSEGNGSHGVPVENITVEENNIFDKPINNNGFSTKVTCDVDIDQAKRIGNFHEDIFLENNPSVGHMKALVGCSLTTASDQVFSKDLQSCMYKQELKESKPVDLNRTESLTVTSNNSNKEIETSAITKSGAPMERIGMEGSYSDNIELDETTCNLNTNLTSKGSLNIENVVVPEECASLNKKSNLEHSIYTSHLIDDRRIQSKENFEARREAEKKESVKNYENNPETDPPSSKSSAGIVLRKKVLHENLNKMNYVADTGTNEKLNVIISSREVQVDGKHKVHPEENSAYEDLDFEKSSQENSNGSIDEQENVTRNVDHEICLSPDSAKSYSDYDNDVNSESSQVNINCGNNATPDVCKEECSIEKENKLCKRLNEVINVENDTVQPNILKTIDNVTAVIEESSSSMEKEHEVILENNCMELAFAVEDSYGNSVIKEDYVIEESSSSMEKEQEVILENNCMELAFAVEDSNGNSVIKEDDLVEVELCENKCMETSRKEESNGTDDEGLISEEFDNIDINVPGIIETGDNFNMEDEDAVQKDLPDNIVMEPSGLDIEYSIEAELCEEIVPEMPYHVESNDNIDEKKESLFGKEMHCPMESSSPDKEKVICETTGMETSGLVESCNNDVEEMDFVGEEVCNDIDSEASGAVKSSKTNGFISVSSDDQSSDNSDMEDIVSREEFIASIDSEENAGIENTTKYLNTTLNFKKNMSQVNFEETVTRKTLSEEEELKIHLPGVVGIESSFTCLPRNDNKEIVAEVEVNVKGNSDQIISNIISHQNIETTTVRPIPDNSSQLSKCVLPQDETDSLSLLASYSTTACGKTSEHILSSEDDSSIDVETVDFASHKKFVESTFTAAVYSDGCKKTNVMSITVPDGDEDSDMPSLELNVPVSPNNSESLEMPCLEIMTEVYEDADWENPVDISSDAEMSLLKNPSLINDTEETPKVSEVVNTSSESERPETTFSNGSVHNWPYLEEEVFSETPRASTQSPSIETMCSGQLLSPLPTSESDSEMPFTEDLECVPCNNNSSSHSDNLERGTTHFKCRLSWDKIFNLTKSNGGKSRGIEKNRKELLKRWPYYVNQSCNNCLQDDQHSSTGTGMCNDSGGDSDSTIGLELGPAKIEVRLTEKPVHDQWQVVDSPSGLNTPSAQGLREENNNVTQVDRSLENSITGKSPIVLVRRIILKRRADEMSVTSSNSNLSQLDCDREIKCLTTPPESDDSSVNLKTHTLPKVIIKRMKNGQNNYESFLRVSAGEDSHWQPVVRLKRIKLIEDMTKKFIRSTCLTSVDNGTQISINSPDRPEEEEVCKDESALVDIPIVNGASKSQNLCIFEENIANTVSIKEPTSEHSKETILSLQSNQNSVNNADTGIQEKVIKSSIVKHIVKPSEADKTHSGNNMCKITKHSRRRQSEGFLHGKTSLYRKRYGSEGGLSQRAKKRIPVEWKPRGHRAARMLIFSESELSGDEEKSESSIISNITKEIPFNTKEANEAAIESCQACNCIYKNDAEKSSHVKTHTYHCQRCNIAFQSEVHFESHLSALHPHSREVHHCLLCKLCFPSAADHQLHVSGPQHRRLDLTQRWTIQTLFNMFTGSPCSRVAPLTDAQAAEMGAPADAAPGAVNYYHQATPLQLAVQELLNRDNCLPSSIAESCRRHRPCVASHLSDE